MDVPEISAESLHNIIKTGVAIVDVREPDEWQEAHLAESKLIPLGEVVERSGEFPTDRPVYVLCRSGVRSASACEYLRSMQIDAINVAGGILEWIASDFEVER